MHMSSLDCSIEPQTSLAKFEATVHVHDSMMKMTLQVLRPGVLGHVRRRELGRARRGTRRCGLRAGAGVEEHSWRAAKEAGKSSGSFAVPLRLCQNRSISAATAVPAAFFQLWG